MAGIVLKNLKKVYAGGTTAVSDFSLEIADKEFVVLVGPSGCGKSTTLRMIAGLEEATSGEIYIDGELMNGVEPKDRDVAMVFQSYALYRHMTVYDNMAFSLKMRKMPKAEIDERVREIAGVLKIEHLLKRKPSALSGGECQRVALGRALVRKPKVFLFDEPLSNLDAKLRTLMRAEIIRLHEEIQTTFVYVTHDQTEAMTMGDRIVVMNHGEIMQADTPQNIYNSPNNKFTAGFIGIPQMNFIENYKNEGKTLGVRPENIHYDTSIGLCLGEGVIEIIEILGSSMNVHCDCGGIRVVLTGNVDHSLSRGDKVSLYADENKLYFFDDDSGEAVSPGRKELEDA